MIEKIEREQTEQKIQNSKAELQNKPDIDKFVTVADNETTSKNTDKTELNENEMPESVADNSVKELQNDNPDTSESGTPDKKTENEPITRFLDTRNQGLEGKTHLLGVPFVRKIVDLGSEKVEGVFPIFDSLIDVQLPKELYKAGDAEQFKHCVSELKKAIAGNPELEKKFNPVQLEQINKEEPRIKGYIWHHNEELGKMQLVDATIHAKVGHTGGDYIWGGRN